MQLPTAASVASHYDSIDSAMMSIINAIAIIIIIIIVHCRRFTPTQTHCAAVERNGIVFFC